MRSELWGKVACAIPGLSAASDQSLGAEYWAVKESTFRPPSHQSATYQLAKNFFSGSALYQGSTSVVLHMQQNDQGALAPEGIHLLANTAERSARR